MLVYIKCFGIFIFQLSEEAKLDRDVRQYALRMGRQFGSGTGN
jgi:hypothetical protein